MLGGQARTSRAWCCGVVMLIFIHAKRMLKPTSSQPPTMCHPCMLFAGLRRRRFFKQVTATCVHLAGLSGLSACAALDKGVAVGLE